LSQGQQLIDSVTAFLNSLVLLLERIENFLRSRNLQVNLNALEAQVMESSYSLGASLVILQTFFTNLLLL